MRVVIRLALPVGLLIGAAGLMLMYEIAHGGGYCATWLSPIMPFCQ